MAKLRTSTTEWGKRRPVIAAFSAVVFLVCLIVALNEILIQVGPLWVETEVTDVPVK